jgi:hypothetical protein
MSKEKGKSQKGTMIPGSTEDSMEAEPYRNYRKITPSTVPVATMTPRTSSASKSVRISLIGSNPSCQR